MSIADMTLLFTMCRMQSSLLSKPSAPQPVQDGVPPPAAAAGSLSTALMPEHGSELRPNPASGAGRVTHDSSK
jgi:hypothetical protein